MILRNPAREELVAEVTTDHAASSYGRCVVVLDGHGCGPEDLPGWTVVRASGQERLDLERSGFELDDSGGRRD